MFKNPRRVFLLIIIFLTIIMAFLDIPDGYHLKFQAGPMKVDRIFSAVTIYSKQITTKLGLDLSGGTELILDANMKGIAAGDRSSALDSAQQVIERRVNFFGVTEPVVQTAMQPGHLPHYC